MKTTFLILIMATTLIIGINQTVKAQSTVNFTKLIEDKYRKGCTDSSDPRVPPIKRETVYAKVLYESPTTMLISGYLIIDDFTNCMSPTFTAFNSPVWNAMDILRNQYVFKLQQVMKSGQGSVGNPTTVYILMTK